MRSQRFEFDIGGLAAYPPGATLGPRVLRDYEFVWIIEGDVVWTCDGKEHSAVPGTVILARPGRTDHYRWDTARQTRHAYFHFRLTGGNSGLPPEDEWPALRHMPQADIVRPLFRHLLWLLDEQAPHWEMLAQGAAEHLLLAFLTGAVHAGGEDHGALPAPVARSLRLVRDQWATGRLASPSLDDLAAAASVSVGHLCRLFQKCLGAGPITTLRLIRLERAATLLARSNLKTQEVSDATGFESPFHFSRCFKATYGLTPRVFRRESARGQPVQPLRPSHLRSLASRFWGEP